MRPCLSWASAVTGSSSCLSSTRIMLVPKNSAGDSCCVQGIDGEPLNPPNRSSGRLTGPLCVQPRLRSRATRQAGRQAGWQAGRRAGWLAG
jgi:hypothetical protein